MLEEQVKQDILTKAEECYPNELCGVLNSAGEFVQMRNAHEDPTEGFRLDPIELADVEDAVGITAIVHSHPDRTSDPSAADRYSCSVSHYPWVIVSYPEGEFSFLNPGEEMPLYGRKFHHGVIDCYTFIKDYYSTRLGIALPEAIREDRWWEHGKNLYLDNIRAAGFHKVSVEELQEHDVILMQIQSDVPNHGAVYLGNELIGHHLPARLSKRDPYGGYWLQQTHSVWRHKDVG